MINQTIARMGAQVQPRQAKDRPKMRSERFLMSQDRPKMPHDKPTMSQDRLKDPTEALDEPVLGHS